MSPESQFVRTFVAIRVSADVLARFADVQRELKSVLPPNTAAWTKPANMHLTLRFLGNLAASRLPQLQSKLSQGVAGFGPLELCCERLGCFPDLRFPRVVWAWVHDAAERLSDLAQHVNAATGEFAEKPAEARFVGHITLARPKKIKRADAGRLADFVNAASGREFGRWTCREVELIQSELLSSGSRYTTLDAFPL